MTREEKRPWVRFDEEFVMRMLGVVLIAQRDEGADYNQLMRYIAAEVTHAVTNGEKGCGMRYFEMLCGYMRCLHREHSGQPVPAHYLTGSWATEPEEAVH